MYFLWRNTSNFLQRTRSKLIAPEEKKAKTQVCNPYISIPANPVHRLQIEHPRLAGSSGWNTHASLLGTTTSNSNVVPSPALAGSAQNVGLLSTGHGSVNVGDSNIGNWDTISWDTGRLSVFIILFDDDTVAGDTGETNILVGDTRYGTGGIADGLDAYSVDGVGNGGGEELDVCDDVGVGTGTASYGSDGESVTSGAASTGESDVLLFVRDVTGTRVTFEKNLRFQS